MALKYGIFTSDFALVKIENNFAVGEMCANVSIHDKNRESIKPIAIILSNKRTVNKMNQVISLHLKIGKRTIFFCCSKRAAFLSTRPGIGIPLWIYTLFV